MFDKVLKVCSNCSREFEGFNIARWTLCGTCAIAERDREVEAYRESMRPQLEGIVNDRLAQLGLGSLEREAKVSKIPDAISDAIPESTVSELMLGLKVRRGFGLGGSMGAGKTMALAAILRASITKRLEANLEALTEAPDWRDGDRWMAVGAFQWVCWPQAAAAMKGAFKGRYGNEEAEEMVHRYATTRLLILDDLGRERMRGAYTEDFAIGQLDRIIDMRSRENLPIMWTTNQDRPELEELYGAAMVDRLCGLAPLVKLPGLPSLRIQ